MASAQNFTEGKIFSPLVRFLFPVLLAMFLQNLYGAIDLLIVGRFSTTYDVSAVATGGQLMQFINGLVIGLSMGTTILLGQQVGSGNREDTGKVVGTGIVIFAVLSAVITLTIVGTAESLAGLLNAPPEAFTRTTAYIRICGLGSLFIVAYNLIGSIFRGMGDSRTPLLAVSIATIANIIGDLLLVAALHMGTKGAAIATIFAQAISVIICAHLIRKGDRGIKMRRSDITPNPLFVKKTLAFGFPVALQDSLVNISFLVILAIVNALGLTASAGLGVAEKIIGFVMLVPSAFGQSLSAVIAQNIGARNYPRAKRFMRYAICMSLSLGIFISYFSFFHGNILCGIFTKDPAVVTAGWQYMKGYSIDVLLTSFLFCFIGYFNGSGKTTFVMIQGIVGAFGVRVPVSYLMSQITPPSLFRISLATPLSSVLQILLCLVYFRILIREENRLAVSAQGRKKGVGE